MTKTLKKYIGIDLGGTYIKGGIVDSTGKIIIDGQVDTEKELGSERVIQNIVNLCQSLLDSLKLNFVDIEGIGLGIPGMIDSYKGEVVYSNNLGWEYLLLKEKISRLTGCEVRMDNDANVAALGEARFGSGKEYKNSILLTLGTGLGSGIIIDGKLFTGNKSMGAELGHSVVVIDGEPCTCGRKGCLETYVSAPGLIRETKKAMTANKNSKMWEIGSLDKVTAKTAFCYMKSDDSARIVVDNYIKILGLGIVNIANAFRPEVIMLGGGIAKEGDTLIKPIQELVDKEVFGGLRGPKVKIVQASLGNKAGIIGAASLLM